MVQDYHSITLPLLRQQLNTGTALRLYVISQSMQPLLQPGDAVRVEPIHVEQIQPGDMVVFQRGTTLITHRLIKTDSQRWWTKGDKCYQFDLPVSPLACIGRVCAIERDGVSVALHSKCWHRISRLLTWWSFCEAYSMQMIQRFTRQTQVGAAGTLSVRLMSAPIRAALWLLVLVCWSLTRHGTTVAYTQRECP